MRGVGVRVKLSHRYDKAGLGLINVTGLLKRAGVLFVLRG